MHDIEHHIMSFGPNDYIIVTRMTEKPSIMEVPYLQPDLAPGVVQREWDQTLHRLRAVAEVTYACNAVRPNAIAYLSIRRVDEHTLAEVERILMSNLLFVLWLRVETERPKTAQHASSPSNRIRVGATCSA